MLSNGVIHFNPYGRKWVRRAPSHKPVSRETEVLKNELKTVSDELQNALVELQAVTANVTTVSDSVDVVTEELQTVSNDVQTVANDVVTVFNSVQTVSKKVKVVSDEKDTIKQELEIVSKEKDIIKNDLNYLGDHKTNLMANKIDRTKKTSQINHILMHDRTMKLAMSGVMELQAPDAYQDSFEVDGYTLNNSEKYTMAVRVQLNTNKYNDSHLWANFDAVISGAENVADADVTAPTFSGNTFVEGKMPLRVHFDVGEGKTYEAGDSVIATVKVSDDSKMLGHTVEDLELTFNII